MSIRDSYKQFGVEKYYSEFSMDYSNPHSDGVIACLDNIGIAQSCNILDFGCGDGIVTKHLNNGIRKFIGVDYYLNSRYERESGFSCVKASFVDIAASKIQLNGVYDYCIMSYVCDIIPKSIIPNLLFILASKCKQVVTIRPNKHRLLSNYLMEYKYIKCGDSNCIIYYSTVQL